MVRSSALIVAVAIMAGAAMVALALYLAPAPGRYRFEQTNIELRRFDSSTGEARACSKDRDCYTFDWE